MSRSHEFRAAGTKKMSGHWEFRAAGPKKCLNQAQQVSVFHGFGAIRPRKCLIPEVGYSWAFRHTDHRSCIPRFALRGPNFGFANRVAGFRGNFNGLGNATKVFGGNKNGFRELRIDSSRPDGTDRAGSRPGAPNNAIPVRTSAPKAQF